MSTAQIISWIASQVLIIAFAVVAAWHHSGAVKAFREYVPTPNPYEDPFHFWGAGMAVITALALSLGLLSYHSVPVCILSGVLSFSWYWLLFDPVLNKSTGKNWDYIRSSKGLDGWLTRSLGKNAGEYKALVMLFEIILINVLKFVL